MAAELSPIPFGTQYYRAPVPLPQDWDRDFAVIKDTGLDCVKLWVQWRWNHPAIRQTDFRDIHGLCDAAHKRGLRVILNAILDVAPNWLFDLYPDAYMVTADGRLAYPTAAGCRQIGGVPGPCYHHAGAWTHAFDFLADAARQFADHPAVWGWDVWNEPELSMNHRYTCEDSSYNMLCHCRATRAAFASWLMGKYGSLGAVNAAHSRNYQTVEQVETPRIQEIYRDVIDFRVFLCETLAQNMRRRAEIIHQHAPGQRVAMHTVPPTALTVTNAACDEWLLAEPVEEAGASFPKAAPLTYEMDHNRSAAKGKRLWSAEFYIDTGDNPPASPAYEAYLLQRTLLPLFHDYKAFLIWQWRNEQAGREGGWRRRGPPTAGMAGHPVAQEGRWRPAPGGGLAGGGQADDAAGGHPVQP